MRLTIGDTVIEVDVEATREAYARLEIPGPEECECCFCRNWAVQRDTAYPAQVIDLLVNMGIRPGFETEVWQATWDDGRSFHSGWYPFVGKILKLSEDHAEMGEMEVWVSRGLSYGVPWLPDEEAHEVHFSIVLDWALGELWEP